jgi:hypothetical protein
MGNRRRGADLSPFPYSGTPVVPAEHCLAMHMFPEYKLFSVLRMHVYPLLTHHPSCCSYLVPTKETETSAAVRKPR